MIVDFPTFGIPHIIIHIPIVENFLATALYLMTSLKFILFLAETTIHLIPTD